MFFRNPATAKRETWIYFTIVIIWSFFIGVAVWKYSQGVINDISSISKFPLIEKSETASWKTYRNEEYGFEIKYPKEWNLCKVEYPKEMKESMNLIVSEGFTPWDCLEGSLGPYPIYISVLDKPSQQYLEGVPEKNKKDILINNIPSVEIKSYPEEYHYSLLISRRNGYINIGEIIRGFMAGNGLSSTEMTQLQTQFNHMLSTFKFLD